jgi:hypothetical protein
LWGHDDRGDRGYVSALLLHTRLLPPVVDGPRARPLPGARLVIARARVRACVFVWRCNRPATDALPPRTCCRLVPL